MNLWYLSSQSYQLSNVMPIYRALGGEFLVRGIKRWLHFKHYLRGCSAWPTEKTLLRTPRARMTDFTRPFQHDGVLISATEAILKCAGPRCRTVFVGHGTGDKPYFRDTAQTVLPLFDYHFISGPKHLAKYRDAGLNLPEEKLIKVGSLRFDDYVNGTIDRERVYRNLGIVDRERKTVLYAPTWSWGNGTLLKYGLAFCKELASRYNVIVRPHGHDRRHLPALRRMMRNAGLTHIYFSLSSNLLDHDTMDDFLVSDILLSDTSSILYEYLITMKPIIVVRTDFDKFHTMSPDLDVHTVARTYDPDAGGLERLVTTMLEEHPAQLPRYREMLHNCFYFNDGRNVERAVRFLRDELMPTLTACRT